MRKWGFVIGILILALGLNTYGNYVRGEASIYSFFSLTGAEFTRMDTEGHSNIRTDESEEEVAARLFKGLGYESGYEVLKENEMTVLNYKVEGSEVNIRVRKLGDENLTYASITLSHYSAGENINNNIRRTMSMAFEDYKVKPSFSSLVSGKFNTRFTPAEMKKRASMVFESSGASFVKGMDDGNLVSLTGYVGGIEEKMEIGNRYINLNIALRYSESNDCTYIWIGSPLITIEY